MRKAFQNIPGRAPGRARRFAGDRRGSMAVAFGAASVMLMMGAGFALDTGQMVLTRSNLLNALDSAVTSTARDLTTGAITEEDTRKTVEAFLFANGGTGFASADKISLDRIDVDRTGKTVSAQASVDVALVFPFFRADPVQHITVRSAAVYSDKHIEVAMMLDVTGSMQKTWRNDKIGDLKKAARNAVGSFLGDQDARNPRVRISLVPYAEGVNVGALTDAVYFEKNASSPDVPPPQDAPLYVSSFSHSNCATERKNADGSADFTDDGPYTLRQHPVYRNKNYLARVNSDDRLGVCPTARLVPLTADRKKLEAAIDTFSADGVTAGGIAAQWGYYMLSPEWRTAISAAGLGSGPADYHDSKVAKIAILMTDGAFNTAFAGVPHGNTRATTPQNQQGDKSRAYAEAICSNMKKDGIEVFTVGFALPSGEAGDARSVLKDCATADSGALKHFYEAADGEELDKVFSTIAANVERLALTK